MKNIIITLFSLLLTLVLTSGCVGTCHYNIYSGTSRPPTETAVLKIKGGPGIIPAILSIDATSTKESRFITDQWNKEYWILPGIHKVTFKTNRGDSQPETITFEAISGRAYRLDLNVHWEHQTIFGAKGKYLGRIIELDTGKVFLPDAPL